MPQTKISPPTPRLRTQTQEATSSSSLNRSKSQSSKALMASRTSSASKKKKLQGSVLDEPGQVVLPRRSRSANTSPSAWALSPGRSSFPLLQPTPLSLPKSQYFTSTSSSARKQSTNNGTAVITGVWKYLSNKMNKVSPAQEQEYHRFRILHNRLLQWRFVNARAEVSTAGLKRNAQKKTFNAWLKILRMRNLVAEKKTDLQRLKQDMKLCYIISSEIHLLKQWARMESRNCEAVGSLSRKLLAVSPCFPLVEGAKGDARSIFDALRDAGEAMEDIRVIIKVFEAQVEKVCFLLTELSVMVKEHNDCVFELHKGLTMVASMEEEEISLRAHCMGVHQEMKNSSGAFLNYSNYKQVGK